MRCRPVPTLEGRGGSCPPRRPPLRLLKAREAIGVTPGKAAADEKDSDAKDASASILDSSDSNDNKKSASPSKGDSSEAHYLQGRHHFFDSSSDSLQRVQELLQQNDDFMKKVDSSAKSSRADAANAGRKTTD